MNKKKAKEILLDLIGKANYKVYISKVYMYGLIKLYVIVENEIFDITYYTGILLGGLVLKYNSYYIQGFDDIVHKLSDYLYDYDYKLKQIDL